jgi:hypothetical protein
MIRPLPYLCTVVPPGQSPLTFPAPSVVRGLRHLVRGHAGGLLAVGRSQDWPFNFVMRLPQAERVGRGATRAPGSLVRASTSSF